MRNALIIFRKDVRHLWPQLAVFLALVAMRSILAPSIATLRAASGNFQMEGLVPLAWCYLIVIVIQQERIPGDRQYWITRPFTGFEVLLGKALFIATFMHLPLLIGHAAELYVMGMAGADILPGLLWRQCLLAAMVTVPAAAIAAATRNLAQFLLGALAIGAAIAALRESLIEHWTGPWWIKPAGLLVVTLGAGVALQMLYSRRDFARARVILGAAAALFVAAMFTDADYFTPIRIVTGPLQMEPNAKAVQASIRLEGAPPTAAVIVDSHTVSATSASIRDYADGRGFLVLGLGDIIPTFRFAGRLELTLYTPQGAMPPPEDTVQIPGVGVCATRKDPRGGNRSLICFSPRHGLALAARGYYGRMEWIVPPEEFEMPNLFESANIYASRVEYPAQLIPARVLARVRGQFDLTGARP